MSRLEWLGTSFECVVTRKLLEGNQEDVDLRGQMLLEWTWGVWRQQDGELQFWKEQNGHLSRGTLFWRP